MSLFTLVFVAALISFAQSRPSECSSSSSSVSYTSSSSTHPSVHYEYESHSSYDDRMAAIVNEMVECMDHKLEPILSKLDKSDKDQLRQIGLAGLSSYVEHLFDLVEEENSKQKRN